MSDPFEFSRSEDEKLALSEAVGQAIGAGSMCWTETPKGIFHSEQASEIVQALLGYMHDRDQVLLEKFLHFLREWDLVLPEDELDMKTYQDLVNQYLETEEYRAQ